MNLNKVFVLGNLTRDPEVRALPSGQSVVNFGIATNRFYVSNTGEKKQEAEFHNIVAFGRLADICSRYLTKGSLVLIEGRLKTRNWQDSSGAKRSRTEIITENIQMAPKSTGKSTPTQPIELENIKREEIPIIEESYEPPAPPKNQPDKAPEEEIDIKDIPF